MTDFLEEIIETIVQDIDGGWYAKGLPENRPARRPSFRAALEAAASTGAVFVEYKRVSPGAESPELPDRSIPGFLSTFEPLAVAGYSCLATRSRFRGSVADVAHLARGTQRPVLFKDFVIDLPQIVAADRTGAAAVLLIARLSRGGHLRRSLPELADAAHARGLEVLVELHDRTELSLLEPVPADVIGVNVRDLGDLRMDRSTARATFDALKDRGPLMGLSGVLGAEEAQEFWRWGADGLLVGTAAARASDPPAFIRSLRRPAIARSS